MPKCEKWFPVFPAVSSKGLVTQCLYSFEGYSLGVSNEIQLETDFIPCKLLIHRCFQFPTFPPLRGVEFLETPPDGYALKGGRYSNRKGKITVEKVQKPHRISKGRKVVERQAFKSMILKVFFRAFYL